MLELNGIDTKLNEKLDLWTEYINEKIEIALEQNQTKLKAETFECPIEAKAEELRSLKRLTRKSRKIDLALELKTFQLLVENCGIVQIDEHLSSKTTRHTLKPKKAWKLTHFGKGFVIWKLKTE